MYASRYNPMKRFISIVFITGIFSSCTGLPESADLHKGSLTHYVQPLETRLKAAVVSAEQKKYSQALELFSELYTFIEVSPKTAGKTRSLDSIQKQALYHIAKISTKLVISQAAASGGKGLLQVEFKGKNESIPGLYVPVQITSAVFPEGTMLYTNRHGLADFRHALPEKTDRDISIDTRIVYNTKYGSFTLPFSYSFMIESDNLYINIHKDERLTDLENRLINMKFITPSTLDSLDLTSFRENYFFIPDAIHNRAALEGILVPGRYVFTRDELHQLGDTPEESPAGKHNAMRMLRRFLDRSLLRFSPYKNDPGLFQNIILASIVEKEAVCDYNYNKVASVFQNRLKYNMALGSCPSVEYSLGYHRPFLTYEDIKTESPYNTYENRGLPPSPISFFSKQAWESVLRENNYPYWFFVYDWTTHKLHFSRTEAEHNTYVYKVKQNFIRKFGKLKRHQKLEGVFYEHTTDIP